MSDTSDELMKVKLNTVDSATCANSLKDDIDIDRIFDTQICAGGKRNQVCKQVSVTPLFKEYSHYFSFRTRAMVTGKIS